MVYGLVFLGNVAVSSQTQRDGITEYAKKHNICIDKFVSYQVKPDITMFKSGDVVVLFAWNCICKERTVLNNFIRHFLKNNICLYSATSAYCLGNGRDFKLFEYAFNFFEDVRFNFVSGRSIDGIKTRAANGKLIGRRKGAKNKRHVLDGKEETLLRMYSDGASLYSIAKKLKVSAPTVKRFLVARS